MEIIKQLNKKCIGCYARSSCQTEIDKGAMIKQRDKNHICTIVNPVKLEFENES